MSQTEQKTLATAEPKTPQSNMPALLGIGAVVLVALLCLGLSGASTVLYLFGDAGNGAAAAEKPLDTAEIASSQEEVAPATNEENPQSNPESPAAEQSDPAGSSLNRSRPTMGPITFAADVGNDGTPLEPSDAFAPGIAKLYAIFEYEQFSPDETWTQVWYHEGREVLQTTQPWLEDGAGTFSYAIETGGEPLAPGQWTLEFYSGESLLTSGSFVIEGKERGLIGNLLQAETAEPQQIYRLAYTKWNGEKHDIYIGDTEGRTERYLMSRGAGPSWSRDGRYLFFFGEEGVEHQYINGAHYPLQGAATGIARVTVNPFPADVSRLQLYQGRGWNDGSARWASVSPDGSMIAFDGNRSGGRRIYFLGTQGNQQFRYEIIGEQADWAPDSQRIVYRSGRNNQTGIWISNRTDSGHVRITTGGTDSFPAWSPDGETIAFSREVGGNVDIYRVNVDGSNLTRLTSAAGHDTLPVYMPNGEIVFRSARGGSWGIWKMNGDGSEQVEIISNAPVGPEWSFSKMSVLR